MAPLLDAVSVTGALINELTERVVTESEDVVIDVSEASSTGAPKVPEMLKSELDSQALDV